MQRITAIAAGLLITACGSKISCSHPSNPVVDSDIVVDAGIDAQDANVVDAYVAPKKCRDGMVLITPDGTANFPDASNFDKRDFDFDPKTINYQFCIDAFEARDDAGMPIVGMNYHTAEAYCASNNKRLATHAEWVIAMQGPYHYLYGNTNQYIKSNCNLSKTWIAPNWGLMSDAKQWTNEVRRLNQSDPVGSHPNCFTEWPAGKIWDGIGNAAEITSDPSAQSDANHEPDHKSHSYGNSVNGCAWINCYRTDEPASTVYSLQNHDKQFASYEWSTRCVNDL